MSISRRHILLASAAVPIVGIAGAAIWWKFRRREPWAAPFRLPDGEPVLRMPFEEGLTVQCQQGNQTREGLTHALWNCLHALDFSNPVPRQIPILTAAPGRVGFVFSGAKAGDIAAGARFGNHVKVEHGLGYFTFYAHLEEVCVIEGQVLGPAAPLGTMGATGAAGNRHLHVSLHRGSTAGEGVQETIRMRALVTTEMTDKPEFKRMKSVDVFGGLHSPWDGHLFGSENSAARAPLNGRPDADLERRIAASQQLLRRAVHDRRALRQLSKMWEEHDAAWAERQLKPMLSRTPDHAIANYWYATAVEMRHQSWDKAIMRLGQVLSRGPEAPTWENWLPSWIYNRLGAIALEQGKKEEADGLFVKAYRRAVARPERRFALRNLRRIRGTRQPAAP